MIFSLDMETELITLVAIVVLGSGLLLKISTGRARE